MFIHSKTVFRQEQEYRLAMKGKNLYFGVNYLDKGLLGIRPNDLILIGAYSGAGKSQLCVNIAETNLGLGKKVHFIALEESIFEVERRLKYKALAREYFSDKSRVFQDGGISFEKWLNCECDDHLGRYEEKVNQYCENVYENLLTFYKDKDFNVNTMVEYVTKIIDETDLVIIDHVHYFDWGDENDNRAVKEIAKNVRDLVLEYQKPIILVSHLRKKDRFSKEICPGLDEFMGSSDLYKIATKVVTMSGGMPCPNGYETFFRMPKNRNNGSVTRYLGKVVFNHRRNCYEEEFKIGWANDSEFGELAKDNIPDWAQ